MTDVGTARHDLITAGLVLEGEGHGDMTRGHVSIRVPGEPNHFFMKGHSLGFDEITEDNILTFDIESELVSGTNRPHSERYIHSEIFRARPDVNAIIHSHPTHTVAFSATGKPMRPLSQGGALFMDSLPVFTGTMDLIRSKETGAAVAASLGPHYAVLMRHHGVTVVGSDVKQAVIMAIMLEEAAKIQLLVMAAGTDGWEFPAEDVASLKVKLSRHDQWEVNFDYLARKYSK